MSLRALIADLDARGYDGRLDRHEPLARYTTFRIGGPADLLFTARRADELSACWQAARAHDVAVTVLGKGSNILVADAGVRGLVLVNACRGHRIGDDGELAADAGCSLSHLAHATARAGWQGLEWAAGIPGTLGGAVIGNAGAFGGCMADVVRSVRVVLPSGAEKVFDVNALAYDYRTSALKRMDDRAQRPVVIEATLRLQRGDAQPLVERTAQIVAQRRDRQPTGHSAGSMFKRTAQYPAGFLIDQAGLKGLRVGGAVVSAKHANFIVNEAGATAADVLALMQAVQEAVWGAFQQWLEPEIELIGEWSADLCLASPLTQHHIRVDRG